MKRSFLFQLTASFILTGFFAIFCRYLYNQIQPEPIISGDTYGYYPIGMDIINNFPKLEYFFNFYRMPLYPLFMNIILMVNNSYGTAIGTIDFLSKATAITDVQNIIGIIVGFTVYAICQKIGFSHKLSFFVTFLHATNMMIIPWEKVLMSEGIAISWWIIFLLISLLLWQKPKPLNFFIFCVISVIGLLLRPATLLLPVIVLIMINIKSLKKITLIYSFCVLVVYSLIPITNVYVNIKYHHYNDFQITGTFNILGRILKEKFVGDTYQKAPFFTDALYKYRMLNNEKDPYAFVDYFDRETYYKPQQLAELRYLTNTIMVNNLPAYAWSSIYDIPGAIYSIDSYVQISPDGNLTKQILNLLQQLHLNIQFIYILTLPMQLISLMFFWKFHNKQMTNMRFIQVIVFIQIFFTVFLGYGQFGRLLSIVSPGVELIAVFWVYKTIKHITLLSYPIFNIRNRLKIK